MIISNSTAHSGYAFHPTNTEPPAADDNDGEDDNDNDRGNDTPINPSAVWAVVASALTTASLTMSSQFPTNTLSSCPLSSTLVDSLNSNLAMDIDLVPETTEQLSSNCVTTCKHIRGTQVEDLVLSSLCTPFHCLYCTLGSPSSLIIQPLIFKPIIKQPSHNTDFSHFYW